MPHKLARVEESKRQKRYIVPGTYENTIKIMQRKNHINALSLMKRAKRGMAVIERKFAHLTPAEISTKQALFIHRVGSRLTDAVIDGMYTNEKSKLTGVEIFEKKPVKERLRIWNNEFDKVIDTLVRLPDVAKRRRTVNYVDGVTNYFQLPQRLFKTRENHWEFFRQIEQNLIDKKINPNQNFNEKVNEIITKNKPGKTSKAKALDVCIAASIYADLMSKGEHTWMGHYIEAMTIAYEKLKTNHTSIIDSITELK